MAQKMLKVNHMLVPKNCRFDSWKSLGDYVMILAKEEALKEFESDIYERTYQIASHILDTVIECRDGS